MKKLLFIASTALILAGCSSSNKSDDTGMAIAPETVYVQQTDTVASEVPAPEAELTDTELKALVKKMFWAMPDHSDYSSNTRGYMTPEFYEATVQGFDAPGNNPGGIGDEEELYYWYMGNDEGCLGDIKDVIIKSRTEKKATATVVYKDKCAGNVNYTMSLVKDGDDWKVADFNGMLALFKKFNSQMRKEYAGNGAERLCRENGVDPDEEYGREFIREVNNYKKKYGIK